MAVCIKPKVYLQVPAGYLESGARQESDQPTLGHEHWGSVTTRPIPSLGLHDSKKRTRIHFAQLVIDPLFQPKSAG